MIGNIKKKIRKSRAENTVMVVIEKTNSNEPLSKKWFFPINPINLFTESRYRTDFGRLIGKLKKGGNDGKK